MDVALHLPPRQYIRSTRSGSGRINMATITRQQIAGLSTLVLDASESPPETAVVLIHGWGADGANLMDISPMLAQGQPKTIFLAPDGPDPCSGNPMGRQWFDLSGEAIDEGPEYSRPALEGLVAWLKTEHKIGPKKVVLIGFSQGGMMALHLGMRIKPQLAGVISFSGALLAPEKLEAEAVSKPPVLLVHGKDDQVVPFQALTIAEAMLKTNAVDVSCLAREGLDHGIDGDGLEAAVAFLAKVFKK
jgi:phospholipase/carboxylesterase